MTEHFYKNMTAEEKEELLSGFMVDTWSYSKLAEFSRNEKAFEMNHIYGHKPKFSSTTIAGQAYHEALKLYFTRKKDGEPCDIVDMQNEAFQYIESVRPNKWKLQTTTPTIEEATKKAVEDVNKLISNFYKEKSVYEDDVDEVLYVEIHVKDYLTINGVDIPIECSGILDLVVKLKDGGVAVIDHKSKSAHTKDEELKLTAGRQGITYTKLFEAFTGIMPSQVWFVENKISTNRNGSPQLNCFKITMDKDTVRLYESLLYEPLKRMIDAVTNPDYVYIINDNDTFIDKAELYDFWCKTMIAEIDEFNVPESKKELVSKRLKKIRDASIASISPQIIKNFKANASEFIQFDLSSKNMTKEEKIEHVLRTFGVITKVSHVIDGYSSDTYLLEVSAGVKVDSIHKFRLDIANALDVENVRIPRNLSVYEGKSYLSVEVSKQREKDVLFDKKLLVDQKIPIGRDNFGNIITWNLNNQSTPHILVCGGTGSGKSVSVRSTIEYAMQAKIEIVILDPKYEFTSYNNKRGVSVFNDIEDIEKKAEELVDEMNQMIESGVSGRKLVVLDEFADAYMMAKSGKELDIREEVQDGYYAPRKMKTMLGEVMAAPVPKMKVQVVGRKKSLEENIQSLLQKGRSSGFRLVLATQRADTKTISGSAKVNLPVQICFRVQKEVDSRVILDEAGAEQLSGAGDGLFRSPEYPNIIRFQAFFKP